MMTESEKKLMEVLDGLSIKYTRYEHRAVYTVDEAQSIDEKIPGQHCKNLFLRNRKGDQHYLVVAGIEKKVDLKALSSQIESSNLSFASTKRLDRYLGVISGAVTPFAIINDQNQEVILLIDAGLVGQDLINFHPNVNTATLSVSYEDLERFIKTCGNSYYIVNL